METTTIEIFVAGWVAGLWSVVVFVGGLKTILGYLERTAPTKQGPPMPRPKCPPRFVGRHLPEGMNPPTGGSNVQPPERTSGKTGFM